jgi:phage tail-like protein
VLFWTALGPRHAVAARTRYQADARIVGCRLDGVEFQRSWGRIFIDACVPRETSLALQCIVTDDDDTPDDQRLLRLPPVNLPDPQIVHDELSPVMPDAAQVQPRDEVAGRVVRRINGSELPWLPPNPDDTFATYEATGTEQRGRYLWLVLVLAGNTRTTPRVRSVRVANPAHDLLRRLPQVLWRDGASESFLQRFLAPLAGTLTELDARASRRRALIDPASAPPEALAWLAGFVGLAFDQRWPVAVRRQLIAEAMPLFRFRGTVSGLQRFIQIVTGVAPVIIEQFRLRGGAVIGNAEPGGSRAIVGAGLRVGGRVGDINLAPLDQASVDDAFQTHAHRFTVMLPALLSDDTLALADWVLERHRPAHTAVTLCSAGSGLRVGRGLHVGLTSVVGRSSGWQTLQLGATALGRDAVVGWPRLGTTPAASRVGFDTRAG